MAKKPKKLAGIDRRGETTWRIRYVKDGKRRTETVTGTQEEAVARRDLIRVEIAQNTWTAPTSMALGEWAATWTEQYLRRAVSMRSYDRQKTIIDRHVVPALGKIPLQKLSAVHINELYRRLGTASDDAPALHPSTIHYVHVVLGSCLKTAVKIGALARNPAGNAAPPKAGAQSGGRALTQPELDKLLGAFGGDPLFPLVALAAGTGARINELLALEWSAIDWDAKRLRIVAALKPTSAGLERGVPKTERSRRTIRLDDGLVGLLKSERDRQEVEQRMIRGLIGVATLRSLLPDDALIFPASPIDPAKPRRHGRGARGKARYRRASFPRSTAHSRHAASASGRPCGGRQRTLGPRQRGRDAGHLQPRHDGRGGRCGAGGRFALVECVEGQVEPRAQTGP